MPSDMRHIPARITPLQRQVLEGAGPVGASARALLWLGMEAAGLELPPEARREILSLLAEDLAPGVLERLTRLADTLRAGEGAATPQRTAAPPASAPRPAPTPATPPPSAPTAAPTAPARAQDPPPAAPAAPAPAADDPYADMGMEFEG